MNLEEAKANIGKEVIYIGDDRELINDVLKGKKLLIAEPTKSMTTNVLIEYDELCFWNIDPKHLKLKEQPMQNHKIKVTPETSEEVQRLFFELGYEWNSCGKKIKQYDNNFSNLFIIDGYIYKYTTTDILLEGITLPQLRDLVVLKRNDVSDATHEHIRSGNKYYRGFKDYVFDGVEWILTDITFPNSLKPINRGMTWQDALCAVADGKDIDMRFNGEFEPLINLLEAWLYGKEFRIKPQNIKLNGEHTKEEWLKILGEMG